MTLELLDRFTIAAVDDMNDLGLDRDAAAMLMIESDMPGGRRGRRARAGRGRLPRRRGDRPRPRRGPAGGRLAAPGAAGGALRARAAGRRPDGGRRRAALARAGHAPRDRARSPRSTTSGSATFGHAGDGNLHPDLVFERGDPSAEAKVEAVKKDLYQAALDLGGTVTGEHGIGLGAARVARDPEGRRRRPRDARDQGRPRSAGHPEPGARHLGLPPARPRRRLAGRSASTSRSAMMPGPWMHICQVQTCTGCR